MRIKEEEIIAAKEKYPKAKVMFHPECPQKLLKLADYIGSTSGMLKYVKQSRNKEFIVGTELGMVFRLEQDNPNKKFYCPSEHFICADMKLTTLGWVAHSLENLVFEVKVSSNIRKKAKNSLARMLEVLPKK